MEGYIAISKRGNTFGVVKFDSIDAIDTDFVDGLHDAGYTIEKIEKEEYDSFDDNEIDFVDLVKNYNGYED